MDREFIFEPMMEHKNTQSDIWQLLDLHPTPTAVVSIPAQICQYTNSAFQKIFGINTKSEISLKDLLHPDDEISFEMDTQNVRLQHQDGSYRLYEITRKALSGKQFLITLQPSATTAIDLDILDAFPGIAIVAF
ncbi:MAG: PAS domain-containing protein, partial [Chloroflexi bacterium]|nr:PAS domain-containing protein [Chloroflexota bacterium]